MIKIKSTEEAWDNGTLGDSEEYATVMEGSGGMLDDALGLEVISIRLEKETIDTLKLIAKERGTTHEEVARGVMQGRIGDYLFWLDRESSLSDDEVVK